jgi:hypothetical protein
VFLYDPAGATAMEADTWSPLPRCETWEGAYRMALSLNDASRGARSYAGVVLPGVRLWLRSTSLRRFRSTGSRLHRRCGCVERSTLGQRKQAGDTYVGDDVTICGVNAVKEMRSA